MEISITMHEGPVLRALGSLVHLAPDAIAEAINATANDGQRAARKNIVSSLTIAPSRIQFMTRLVKIEKYTRSSGSNIQPIAITVEAPGLSLGKERDRIVSMLERHERGGVHIAPNEPFFIPTKALRSGDTDLVPRAMYPSFLGLADRRGVAGETIPGGRRGAVRTFLGSKISNKGRRTAGLKGLGGTFLVPNVGIFQRIGTGQRDVRMIWSFRRRISIPPRLEYVLTIKNTVREEWPKNAARQARLMIRKAEGA